MKIKSVKIFGDFRSIASNKLYEFNDSFRVDRLSTKVFAGLNGSGKSNFLELFSEIFYYLEIYHLDTTSAEEKQSKSFGFEIEYFLPYKFVQKKESIFIEITPRRREKPYNITMGLPQAETKEYNEYIKILYQEYIDDIIKNSKNYLLDNNVWVKIEKRLDGFIEFSIYNYTTNQFTVIREQNL
ncbi:MAG: hypothetical protein QM710_06030 [Flavobacterium sp.]